MKQKIITALAAAAFFTGIFAEELFFIERGDTIFLTPDTKSTRSQTLGSKPSSNWLRTSTGHRVKLADGVVVQVSPGASPQNLFNSPQVKSYEQIAANIYHVLLKDNSEQLSYSRELLKNPLVLHSNPNMVREIMLR